MNLEIQPDIQLAIASGKPVVALESTIISHGMPYPKNVETAREVESVIRERGAIPATIAIFGGKCRVGLNDKELEYFASAKDVEKVSLRDIPVVLAKNLYGATTVAATMRIASMAGICVFVTGGIGGVHRGAETSMDISADLTEMGETSVAVVSAGVKSILDIGLTLEYLETKGVPVITYGEEEFPSFYSRKSGFRSPFHCHSIREIASILKMKWDMGLNGSVLIANPVPVDQEIDQLKIETYIQEALHAAAEKKISGKKVTPFLLEYIASHTAGESLDTNIALIKNNAAVGAELAIEFCSL